MTKLLSCLSACLLLGPISGFATPTQEALNGIARTHVPDSRLGVFEIQLDATGTRLVGATTSREALAALNRLSGLKQEITLLPDAVALGGKTQGLVNVPVATLYKKPSYTSAVQTQAILGTPVEVLRGKNWLQVRLPDGYIAWVPREQIASMRREVFQDHLSAGSLMVTANEAVLRSKPSRNAPRLMLLAAGSRLGKTTRKTGVWTCATLPDAREGCLRNDEVSASRLVLKRWDTLRSAPSRYGKALSALAQSMLGQSYLWAGTSSFGMDCSGFVQTVFLRTGLIFPRDTDQQARIGARLKEAAQAGDLLFFGRKLEDGTERISHVALCLGGSRFIHCRGFVRCASLDANDPDYDAYEKGRFLFAVRPDLKRIPRIEPAYTNQAEVNQIH